ncbi:hypothetical protein Sa4125_07030 [Aureimonas sp. SA4125]|uniref:group III truncated hemoglobin n=1 Tax=Aureimonas sp. SA4125 TaxID=2826993 RepID=UPI001CC43678|nr:group III truncated hemoglobin [Aureimonas sp. SA4125]BDA83161.1 hypothetical protein Sa4125_07030 [Aureimonas sp. SA4125]
MTTKSPPPSARAAPEPLSETDLRRLVGAFYEDVRADPLLGPIFKIRVDDWDAHSDRVADFWSSIMLGSGRYKGNPFGAHLPFRERLSAEHFERWLALWSATARRLFEPATADLLAAKARRIADSLQAGLLFRPETPAGQRAVSLPST